MSTKTPHSEKRTATRDTIVGPNHCTLGTDTEGCIHHWDRRSNTIHVIHPSDGRTHSEQLDALSKASTWVEYVTDRRGWERCTYETGPIYQAFA